MAGSEHGSMDEVRGQIFTVLGTYEVRIWRLLAKHVGAVMTIILVLYYFTPFDLYFQEIKYSIYNYHY